METLLDIFWRKYNICLCTNLLITLKTKISGRYFWNVNDCEREKMKANKSTSE